METILIVDDDKDMQFTLSSILREEGYETITAGDAAQAMSQVKARFPNLVLLDIKLPGRDGMRILEEMKRFDKHLITIMLTAYGDVKRVVRAMKLGAFDYVTKPFDNDEIVLVIKRALQTQHLSKEVESLRRRLGERTSIEKVTGEGPRIRQVLSHVRVIAPTDMTVILQGESGTGKELIAQMIRQESKRKDNPFIAIDCGAIPEALAESELFGYEKGAFTGAYERKQGEFERADGGTLFLDEITNLSDAVQMKLLRVIEERKLQHLGGSRDIRIDVRIIVGTNTNLSEAVRAGKFRHDLFHRLNEFHIDLPPLRERKDDLPVLARCFLDGANQELDKDVKGISSEAMKIFLDYRWPGNVRELKNVVRRAVLLAKMDEISCADLPKTMLTGGEEESDLTKTLSADASFDETIRCVEGRLIQRALGEVEGSKKKAAELLGMNRKALYRKMKRLRLV